MAKIKTNSGVKNYKVVGEKQWLAARKALLLKEKKLTKLRDAVSAERRKLPWRLVEKAYVFDGPNGKETLSDLFGGKSQLVIWHFMLGPNMKDGCTGCSFWADSFNGNIPHLAARDIRMMAVSRATMKKIVGFKKRMGWSFHWVSSHNNDFNVDYQVSSTREEFKKGKGVYNYEKAAPNDEMPGVSVFAKDTEGVIFHTYSTYARGMDPLNAGYQYIDLTPKGRDEYGHKNQPGEWFRHHDKYPK